LSFKRKELAPRKFPNPKVQGEFVEISGKVTATATVIIDPGVSKKL
jgi:hypothetical protein